MDLEKRMRLEDDGWVVGDFQDFLGLSDAEAAYVHLTGMLRDMLPQQRKASGMTQRQLAKKLESSQSRVAKMEKGDPSVSLDLLMRGVLEAGATIGDVARWMLDLERHVKEYRAAMEAETRAVAALRAARDAEARPRKRAAARP